MSTVTCAGAAVLRGSIIMPSMGRWVADLVTDSSSPPSGRVEIKSHGGLTLSGTVVPGRTGAHLDTSYVRIVGGAGGLDKPVAGVYRQGLLRDPLNAIMSATGEQLASDVSAAVLATSLARWTMGRHRAGRALDELAAAAGGGVRWRITPDGKVWIGIETWPSLKLGAGDVIEEQHPSEGRTVLAIDTLRVYPGVNILGVGNVKAAQHWIEPTRLRTWLWT